MPSLGIYNFKARMYDPALGRFLSADTVTPPGPQGLNRYAYVNNNPINGVDPSGHLCIINNGHPCIQDDDYAPPPPRVVHELILKRILIGHFDSYQFYGADASDDTSCSNCWTEPAVQKDPSGWVTIATGGAEAPGVFHNGFHDSSTDDVNVYLNYSSDSEGNVTTPSLSIGNNSGADLSVMSVMFQVSGPNTNTWFSLPHEHQLFPHGMKAVGIRPGGGRQSYTDVDLTPKRNQGYSLTFQPWDKISISISIANSWTGQYYPGIQYSSYAWQIGQ